jgi:hypothetical protein
VCVIFNGETSPDERCHSPCLCFLYNAGLAGMTVMLLLLRLAKSETIETDNWKVPAEGRLTPPTPPPAALLGDKARPNVFETSQNGFWVRLRCEFPSLALRTAVGILRPSSGVIGKSREFPRKSNTPTIHDIPETIVLALSLGGCG